MNSIKQEKVAIDEIKRDRDLRIEKLRDELLEVNETLENVNKEHAALQVRHQFLQEEYSKIEAEYKSMGEQLNQANDIRQTTEESLKRVKKDYELQSLKLKNEVESG